MSIKTTLMMVGMSIALLSTSPALASDEVKPSFSGVHVGAGLQWFKQEGAVVNGEDVDVESGDILTCESLFFGFCIGAGSENVITDIISEPFRVNGNDETGWAFLASLLALQQTGNFVVGAELGGEIGDEVKGGFAMLRIGLAMANVMPYLHGGVGYEVQDIQAGEFKLEDGRVTGRLGGGVMWMINNQFSLDANYTYIAGGDLRERFEDVEIEAGDQRHAVGVTARIKLN